MKLFSSRKGLFYGTFFILIIILFILTKIALKPVSNTLTINTPNTPKYISVCSPYSKDLGKVSCEEAIEVALKALPGSVLKIEKTNMSIIDSNNQASMHKLWLVTIRTDKLLKNKNEFAIGISTVDKKIKYSSLE